MFFDVFWGPKKADAARVGGRGGTQLFEYKNKALVTCTSIPCFRSATGVSTCSLVGRPSTRSRIYFAFGEHPAAGGWGLKFVGWDVSVLCVVCVCLCVVVCLCVFVYVCVCVFVSSGVLLVVCV